ncbi:MAG: hypothetical protein B7Z60_06845 [Ferrovum sp. 37-45-19]|nr:MAG: hypothetical protein B7Z65_09000 [Ferrovum sp. 21-44-67]OYV93913.1 MAG: hypothetical protein B7Z60_06845 [Ferrovum sp. 37-45-19]OZB32019.1 MAG: hypothetical protein B7X47_07815 [Ferrovum sp. 34-44-207]HQT81970.1 TIM barrel protein [Ferrovaceae bacterium]HQU07094.1 TIM barrel protein [Ferrovaceae bacterium]
MPRFCANLSWLYQELPFLERFKQASLDGFTAVEHLFPYEFEPQQIAYQLQQHQLSMQLINAPAGNWHEGDRGIAIDPQRQRLFRELFEGQAIPTALALNCPLIHVMSGVMPPTQEQSVAEKTFLNNLEWALNKIASLELTLLIEPISQQTINNYYLTRQAQALAIIDQFSSSQLKLQLDIFHCQLTEGSLTEHIQHALQRQCLGHIQIAGVPLRQEPNDGEVNYSYLFKLLDQYPYQGYVGCEYSPRGNTTAGLDWYFPYRP